MRRGWALVFVGATCGACTENPPHRPGAPSASAKALVSAAPGPSASPSAAAREPARRGPNPCELLSAAMLRKQLSLPEKLELRQRLPKHTPHPHCSYSWSRRSAQERQADQAEMTKQLAARAKQGKLADGIADVARLGSEEAHLTLLRAPFESQDKAQKVLASIRETMSKGVARKVGGEARPEGSNTESVEGVGDAAFWTAKMNQLSVASGTRVFHLGVRTRDESANLDLAKALAKGVIEKL